MARYLLIFSFLLTGIVSATAQSSLSGKVTDADTGEPILFGTVTVNRNGALITGTETDFDGNYVISPIDPGTYDVVFSYVGYASQEFNGVVVLADKEITVNSEMSQGQTLDEVVVIAYEVPLVEQDNTTQGKSLTSKDIANLPSKNINGIVSQVAGVGSADEGDDISIRGSRSDGTFYYIDGIRVAGNLIPQSEIEQLQVITGGIGAKYGDVTGGVISITTKGPSSNFGGGFDLETSEYLDPYGYNLASAYLNGPILKNKDGETVLGYRFSGQYRSLKDDDPPATDIFRISDASLAELEANPVFVRQGLNGSTQYVSAADFLTNEDVDVLDFQPFEQNERLDLTAKVEARLSDAIDIAFTGTYSDEEDRFTPGEANRTGTNWRVLNSHNNPFENETRYRGNIRFRHRLGKTATAAGGDEAQAGQGNAIRNASYTLQAGLEQYDYQLGDHRHGSNLFDYGYVGSFNSAATPLFAFNDTTGLFEHNGYDFRYVEGSFVPGTVNPVLANYNNEVTGATDLAQFPAINGLTFDFLDDAHAFHTNVGTVYNLFRKRDEETLTLQASAGFDLMPGGSEKGKHSIEFGFLFEQRTNRLYEMNPRDLWTLVRQTANRGLNGVDENEVLGQIWINPTTGQTSEEQVAGFIPTDLFGAGGGNLGRGDFFENVRNLTGQSQYQYVDADALNPNDLSLDMFLVEEILSNGDIGLNYYGYDYLGNDFDGTFDDFFTARDANGNFTRPVAPFRPNYTAAYLQDKFKFRDIIIRAGVRLDRYDANTRVLRDPYSLYEITTAADFDAQNGTTRPNTIGDDFKVYVDGDQESTSIIAYRNGDTWFSPSGTQANDASDIFGGAIATPKLVSPSDNIANEEFVNRIDASFEDYTPQVNIMPRLAFSFPISENANFFAHYDILVQRPPRNAFAGGIDYLFFTQRNIGQNSPKPNSNLKPEKTIDYEVGFQQKLSNSSALKIAAYYREFRDMIQFRIYQNIQDISNYFTYDNLDFGTTKGFSFQYDLRRTGNIQLNASYTLQFADGTGSDANSSRGLSTRGVLRVLYPLSFDERHRITLNADYRYSKGKKYNGPELFGKQIFADAGVNLQMIAVSGRPYTARTTPLSLEGQQTQGSINGARLPWNNTLNLRVDKNFELRAPKDGKSGLLLNVYFRVSNLLDRRNIVNVYRATGSPFTDGFLESALGETTVAAREIQDPTIRDEFGSRSLAFADSYQWRVLNPNFLSLPRRMYLGVRFDF